MQTDLAGDAHMRTCRLRVWSGRLVRAGGASLTLPRGLDTPPVLQLQDHALVMQRLASPSFGKMTTTVNVQQQIGLCF